MNGRGIVDRLGVMFPMLVIEVVAFVALSFLYHIAVHRKMIKDGWGRREAFRDVLGCLAIRTSGYRLCSGDHDNFCVPDRSARNFNAVF